MKIFTVFILLSLIGLSSVIAQINLDSGLVAKYYFNGNANDESGNYNHGTVYGATLTTDRFGIANSAYSFNGINNYILVNNSNSLNILNSISLCTWFQTVKPAIGSTFGFIVAKAKKPTIRQYYLATTDSTILGDSLYFCVIKTNDDYIRPTVHSNFWDNKWHFMVGTYDYTSGNMKIYVDNQLLVTKAVGQFNLEQSTIPLTIGCYHGIVSGFRDYFKGNLDNIRIYNRAITTPEVDALYNEYNCSGIPSVSISGLNPTYTQGDSPTTLIGIPSGGTFYGVGIIGNTFSPSVAGVGTHTIVYVYDNGYGCTETICESVDITLTKVKAISNDNNDFNIYPNPTNIFITIDTKNSNVNSIEIFDSTGSIVFKDKFKNSINISKLTSGVYLLKILDKKGNLLKTEKIIKE